MSGERLSAFDAFFLAYQRRAGIAMHLGLDVSIEGSLDARAIQRGVDAVLEAWPALGSPVRAGLLGVRTTELVHRERIVQKMPHDDRAVDEAINAMIDPFAGPALRVHWRDEAEIHRVILRVHHAMMDGEGFAHMAMVFFAAMANTSVDARAISSSRPRSRSHSIAKLLGEKRARDRRSLSNRHPMLPLACIAPGPVSVVNASLRGEALARAIQRAASLSVSPALWVIAAWARTVHGAIEREGQVAIEVPVSLRARDDLENHWGNHIAPLVLYADARRPIEAVARGLRASFRDAVARGHLEIDRRFAAPGALLPWPLFERVAINPSTTGNATSHVAAVRVDRSVRAIIESSGALRLARWAPFSPVCLKMGAALSAIQASDEWALAVTYRRNAMSESLAKSLLDRVCEELG